MRVEMAKAGVGAALAEMADIVSVVAGSIRSLYDRGFSDVYRSRAAPPGFTVG